MSSSLHLFDGTLFFQESDGLRKQHKLCAVGVKSESVSGKKEFQAKSQRDFGNTSKM
jgi:hypothetical protein